MPFTIVRNDLSAVAADAIVVAANERLQITGGVGMTVALAAGIDDLQAACDEIGYCPCGSAVATPAFGLDAKTIVHAVGPVWQGGGLGEADFLRSAYDSALECAVSEGAHSIALPLISAGTYGFPADVSLAVARESIRTFLNRHDDIDVQLVLYSRESVTAGMAAYLDIAEYVDDHYVEEHPARGATVLSDSGWLDERWPSPAGAQSVQAPKQRGKGLLGHLGAAREKRRRGRTDEAIDQQGDFAAFEPAAMPEAASRPASAVTPEESSTYAPAATPEEASAFAPAASREAASGPAPAQGDMLAPTTAPIHGSARLPISFGESDATNLTKLLNSLDAPFSTTLLALIDERGMTDAQVYKRANMSRQLFSKIRSDADYRPTKKTVLALAVALGLNLDETTTLLARAGFALSTSNKADVIVEYFIDRGNYDIFEINEALYAFDQQTL